MAGKHCREDEHHVPLSTRARGRKRGNFSERAQQESRARVPELSRKLLVKPLELRDDVGRREA